MKDILDNIEFGLVWEMLSGNPTVREWDIPMILQEIESRMIGVPSGAPITQVFAIAVAPVIHSRNIVLGMR